LGWIPNGCKIVTTSPNREIFNAQDMRQGTYRNQPIFMPLWEKAELKDALTLLKPAGYNASEFEDRFLKYGGVFRAFVETTFKNLIEDAIDSVEKWDLYTTCTEVSVPRHSTASSRLMYPIVELKDRHGEFVFLSTTQTVGTLYLGNRLAQKYVQYLKKNAKQALKGSFNSLAGGAQGEMFESIQHALLCMCREGRAKRLGRSAGNALFESEKSPHRIRLFSKDQLDFIVFEKENDGIKKMQEAVRDKIELYLRPESLDYPAIDSVMVVRGQVWLIQITKQMSRRRVESGNTVNATFKAWVDGALAAGMKEVPLIYVVFQADLQSFKVPKLLDVDKDTKAKLKLHALVPLAYENKGEGETEEEGEEEKEEEEGEGEEAEEEAVLRRFAPLAGPAGGTRQRSKVEGGEPPPAKKSRCG
jgi:hypothetical protein